MIAAASIFVKAFVGRGGIGSNLISDIVRERFRGHSVFILSLRTPFGHQIGTKITENDAMFSIVYQIFTETSETPDISGNFPGA